MPRKLFRAVVVAALAVFATGANAERTAAQVSYPAKPIQLVIPYPPGGSDVLGRKLVIGMSATLGQPIVVVNKPGASTQVATAYIAAAAPDGYTLYMASPVELAAGPSLFKSLPFDALKDLTPISHVAFSPFVLTTSIELPVKTFSERVAFAKANADKVRFGTYGLQTQPDVLARRVNQMAGTDLLIVPYQGAAPVFNAIVRNEVQLLFSSLIPSRPFIVGGQIRPLAIAATERVALYPDLPTLKELGLDIVEAAEFGLMGPKGLPAEVVAKIRAALVTELQKPDVKQFLDGLGIVPVGSSPEDFGRKLALLTTQWAELAPKLGLEKQ